MKNKQDAHFPHEYPDPDKCTYHGRVMGSEPVRSPEFTRKECFWILVVIAGYVGLITLAVGAYFN